MMQGLNCLYPGHFSGLHLQLATLRDEVMSPSRQRVVNIPGQCLHPVMQPTARVDIHPGPSVGGPGVWITDTNQRKALATALAMSNKALRL